MISPISLGSRLKSQETNTLFYALSAIYEGTLQKRLLFDYCLYVYLVEDNDTVSRLLKLHDTTL